MRQGQHIETPLLTLALAAFVCWPLVGLARKNKNGLRLTNVIEALWSDTAYPASDDVSLIAF